MTLDDAIVKYEYMANDYKRKINYLDKYKKYMTDYDDDRKYYIGQREKYMQLALWLKELRVRRDSSCSCYDDFKIKYDDAQEDIYLMNGIDGVGYV